MESTRVRLISMPNDPDPIPVGTEGTVVGGYDDPYGDLSQIWVKWDNGRTLNLIPGVDMWEALP